MKGDAGAHWTGHALVDVGLAGICALAKVWRPEDLSLSDLDGASNLMERHYYDGKMNAYLTCVFMNSSFVQPNEGPDKREAFVRQYVRAHRASPDASVAGLRCAFSGAPATSPLVRTHLPLFSGEDVFNFRPDGKTFVPAAGVYVTSLLFLPLASRKAEGRLLAVHTDDGELTIRMARRYLTDNLRLLELALPGPTERALVHRGFDRERVGWDPQKKKHKYADVKGPRSLLIDDLTTLVTEAGATDLRDHPVALTAYWLSSSGQGPVLDTFDIPAGVARFAGKAAEAETATAWKAVRSRFRSVTKKDDEAPSADAAEGPKTRGKSREPEVIRGRAGWSRNQAFEDLCGIFDAGFTDRWRASAWLRTHLLGRIETRAGDIRYRGTNARSWKLAELFLTEVMGMDKARIAAIRRFADKVADHIATKNDKRLAKAITYGKLSEVQHRLRRAQQASAGSDALLFGLEEYAAVWLQEDRDAFLVRDLLTIRVVEELHARGWFQTNPDAAVVDEEDKDQPEEEARE